MKQFLAGIKAFFCDVYSDLPGADRLGYMVGALLLLFGIIFGIVAIMAFFMSQPTEGSSQATPIYSGQVRWERYTGDINSDIYRLRTPQGWLVSCHGDLVYVPDERSQWSISKSEK